MDRTVPAGAALLLDFIRKTEVVGRADRASYDVIYGHNQNKLIKPITSLTIDELVDLQARLGYHLLKRGGYEEFMAGQIGEVEFGRRLAMEWASFPVLADVKGAHRLQLAL